jgi:hypothetical protein
VNHFDFLLDRRLLRTAAADAVASDDDDTSSLPLQLESAAGGG